MGAERGARAGRPLAAGAESEGERGARPRAVGSELSGCPLAATARTAGTTPCRGEGRGRFERRGGLGARAGGEEVGLGRGGQGAGTGWVGQGRGGAWQAVRSQGGTRGGAG